MKRIFTAFTVATLLSGSLVSVAGAQTQNQALSQYLPLCTTITTNLTIGSQSSSVSSLQDFLRALGFFALPSTGYFGAKTAQAVKDFQTSSDLPPVGNVGPLTRSIIQKLSCTPAPDKATVAPTPVATSTATTTPPAATTSPVLINVTGSSGPTLPYDAITFNDWKSVWGDVSTSTTGTLLLKATVDTNGAEAVLPTAKDWDNYKYTANVSVANGDITLIARYVDDNNFVACTFAKDWVQLDQRSNGTTTTLASKSVNGILDSVGSIISTAVSMNVNGNSVGCAGFGPQDNVSYTIHGNVPLTGGIGIQTYYSTPLAAQLEVQHIKVEPLQ